MVWLLVIGEGRPARVVIEVAAAMPGVTIDAVVIEHPESDPLASFARRLGIEVVERRVFAAEPAAYARKPGGWLISANSTVIMPPELLERFGGRSLNFHPGLLPEYAGLHTHQWAIRNGEREFGVTVHRMERAIDTGAIVGQVRLPVEPDDTGLSLYGRCLTAGAELFASIVGQIVRGDPLAEVPQDLARRRLYRHRDALDGRIQWNWSAASIVDFIRAGDYEPFASPTYVARLDKADGFDIEVLRASTAGQSAEPPGVIMEVSAEGPLIACGEGTALRILRARNSGKIMSREKWLDYRALLPSRRLLGRGEAPA